MKARLGVNIDHVATIRNARGGAYPDPVRAAEIAAAAGADGITLHIREDRRHVREDDLLRLQERVKLPVNLEMACTEEMLAIALKTKPHAVCLVPERREERTTEGGLDVHGGHNQIAPFVAALAAGGSRVSLFIDPDPNQIETAHRLGAPVVELHTGTYCDLYAQGGSGAAAAELAKISSAVQLGVSLGIEVHAGHGITFDNVAPLARLAQIAEFNIGHFLIGEAIFSGLAPVIQEMRARIDAARAGA